MTTADDNQTDVFASVQMLPSGHRVEVPPGVSIVEAALSAGIYVPYGCNNGTCGDCVARVVSGELVTCRHSDYVIDAARKQQGFRLLCCTAPRGVAVVEVQEADDDHLPAAGDLSIKLQKLEPLSDGCTAVKLRCVRSALLRYVAGQKIELRLPGATPLRVTLASCPCEGLNLELHLENDRDADQLRVLHGLRRGDEVAIHGPLGGAPLPRSEWAAPVLLVAVDAAFSAVQSLLAHLINIDYEWPIRVLWLANPAVGHYRANYLRALGDTLDDLRFELADARVKPTVALTRLLEDVDRNGLHVYAALKGDEALRVSLEAAAPAPTYL